MLDDPPYGMTRGECRPFFVAVDHPEKGPLPWPENYSQRRLDFAVMDEPPAYWTVPESPVMPPLRTVSLERRELFAERCLVGWAFIPKGHDPEFVLRLAFPEFREFALELAYEQMVMEPRRHAHLLSALRLR